MPKLPKWILDCLTGPDNQTFDVARIAFVGGLASFIGLAIYNYVIRHQGFDPSAFGTGFAAITGGSGAAIAMKQWAGAEPPHRQDRPC